MRSPAPFILLAGALYVGSFLHPSDDVGTILALLGSLPTFLALQSLNH